MAVEVDNKGWMWIVAGAVTLIAAVLMGVLQASQDRPQLFDDGAGHPASDLALFCVHSDQCERPGSEKLIVEVQNTFSNLAYLLFGVCVLVRSMRPGAGPSTRPSQAMFGAGLCLLAACSAWYHGSLNGNSTVAKGGAAIVLDLATGHCTGSGELSSDTPQIWDIVGVYLAMMLLVLHGVDHLLRKDLNGISSGSKIAALVAGVGLVVATIVICGVAGALPDAMGVAVLLVILSSFVFAARVAGRSGLTWLSWVIWGVIWLLCAYLAYLMRASLKWDSTFLFAAMAGFLAALLTANWLVSGVRLPWPEILALVSVFLMGIVPRLVDGYDLVKPTVKDGPYTLFLKDFCAPDNFIQAHALWHLLSALSLILVYDMLEKSRGDSADTPSSTVLLPQDNRLDAGLRRTLPNQPPLAVLFNAILTTASLVLLIVLIANYERSGVAFLLMSFVPLVCSAILWLWPLIRGAKD